MKCGYVEKQNELAEIIRKMPTTNHPKLDAAWIDEVLPIAEAAKDNWRPRAITGFNEETLRHNATFDPPTVIRMLKELRRLEQANREPCRTSIMASHICIRGTRACTIRHDALAAQEKP